MANRYTFSNINNLNGAHLGFTSGLQNDLNNLITAGGAVEGTFYLTTDTHRLYIGRTVTADTQDTSGSFTTKTIPIPVNEGIQTVDNVSGLPNNANAGEFYYVSGSNILAVYNGTQWVQINPNTNTDTEVSSASVNSVTEYQLTSDSVVVDGKTYYTRSGSEGAYIYTAVNNPTTTNLNTYYEPYRIKYTLTVNQATYDKTNNQLIANPTAVVTSFYINSSDIASVLSISAGIARSQVSNNASEISLDGGISNGHTVTLKGGTNITLSSNDTDTITIEGPNYNLSRGTISNDTVAMKLRLGNQDQDSINIIAGNHLSLDTNDSTGITIHHDTPGAATQTNGVDNEYGKTGTNYAPTLNLNGASSSTLTIPSFKVDAYGHITAVQDSTVTLNGIKQIKTSETDGKVSLIAQSNAAAVESAAHALSYQITVDGNTSTIDNKGNLGTFYSAEGVDARIEKALQGANALIYKGVVGSQIGGGVLTLPTENVQVGDTYLVASGATDIYTKTLDTSIVNGKKYYTQLGGGFTEVQSPNAADLTNYYEKVIVDGVEAGDLLIATGDEHAITSDTVVNSLKTYYTRTGTNHPYIYTKVTPEEGSNPHSLGYYEDTGIIQDNLSWTYVPSGDDIDTQYALTADGGAKTIKLRNTVANEDVSTIKFIAGNKITPANITIDNNNHIYEVAFNHDTMNGLTDGTSYGAGVTGNSGTFTDNNKFSIPNFTVDNYGHIKSASTTTYTLPAASSYKLRNNIAASGPGTYGTTLNLFKDNGIESYVVLTGNAATDGGVSVAANSETGDIQITHRQLPALATNDDSLTNYTTSASTTQISNDDNTFSALTALDIDIYGHVSKYKVTKFGLPSYTLNAAAVSNKKATVALRKNNSDVAKFSITSDNLTITNNQEGNEQTYTMNLEWGSFTAS